MKVASATSETAQLPVLTDPLEAPAHFGQMEALFRNTVEHAPVGIAFANPDGSFRHCNRAFRSMLGFSAEAASPRSSVTRDCGAETSLTWTSRSATFARTAARCGFA